jgi:hypothetical protein
MRSPLGRLASTLAPAAGAAALVLVALAGIQPVAAQSLPGGRGAFQIGFQASDLDPLNARLTTAGLPAFEDGFVTLGGFGLGRAGRILIGGEGHGMLPREEDSADGTYRTRLSGGYGLFNLGYLAHSGPRLDVYPLVGIGGGGMSLEIVERTAPTFDDVLADPARSTRLASGTFLLSAAVGADLRLGGGDRDRRHRDRDDDGDRGGLFVGVRAGWLWAPGDTSWELDGLNDVAGGPAAGPEGFYVRVSLGGWGGD